MWKSALLIFNFTLKALLTRQSQDLEFTRFHQISSFLNYCDTVRDPSEYLSSFHLMCLGCSCDADAGQVYRGTLLAQQLEVHKVLKVELQLKVSGFSMLHLDMSICVWKSGKGVSMWECECQERKSWFCSENLVDWKSPFALFDLHLVADARRYLLLSSAVLAVIIYS